MTSVLILVVALHAPPARPAPLPVYHAAPTVFHAAPPVFHGPPPVFHVDPPVYHVAPVYHPAPPISGRMVPVDLPIKRATLQARPRWSWPGLWNPVVFWQRNPYCFGSPGSYWGEWGMLATPNDVSSAYQYGPWGGNAWLLGSSLQTFCGTPAFIGL